MILEMHCEMCSNALTMLTKDALNPPGALFKSGSLLFELREAHACKMVAFTAGMTSHSLNCILSYAFLIRPMSVLSLLGDTLI